MWIHVSHFIGIQAGAVVHAGYKETVVALESNDLGSWALPYHRDHLQPVTCHVIRHCSTRHRLLRDPACSRRRDVRRRRRVDLPPSLDQLVVDDRDFGDHSTFSHFLCALGDFCCSGSLVGVVEVDGTVGVGTVSTVALTC